MDVQELDQFARLAVANNSTVWNDMIGRYEISFDDHYISLIKSTNHEILLYSERCEVLLLKDLNCIVSIGGFQAHNDGKYLAEMKCLPLVTIPTQLANDSFGTNRYSITDNEQSESIETVFPVKTIFDIPYLQANGIEKSLWGIGEFIGLYFSIIDYSMKSHLDYDGLLSWIVEQIHELNSLYDNGYDRKILKKIAILLTIKCLVMRTNRNHEIGCGIDHSFARCLEKNNQLPHGKAVFLGSLLALVLFPEWENYGLSLPLLLRMGIMIGITPKEIQHLQLLDLQSLIRGAIQVRPKRSQSLESIIGEQSHRIGRANEQIQRLVWED